MCTYNITLEDSLIERVRPAFRSEDALQQWMTEKMRALLLSFPTSSSVPPCSYSDEEMSSIVKSRLQSLECGTAELIDGDEMFSQIRTRYGIKAEVVC